MLEELSFSMSRLVIAVDLDGTVIDSSHRARFLPNGDFDLPFWVKNSTAEMINKDKLLPVAHVVKEFMKTGFTVIGVTARIMEEADFQFLKKHDLNFELVLHREDSLELDSLLKSKRLQEYFKKSNKLPFIAIDDSQANLEVFDRFGFRTFHAKYLNTKLLCGGLEELQEKHILPKNYVRA